MSVLLTWESNGVTVFDLDDEREPNNIRSFLTCFHGMAFITIIYSVGMISVGKIGIELSAIMVK